MTLSWWPCHKIVSVTFLHFTGQGGAGGLALIFRSFLKFKLFRSRNLSPPESFEQMDTKLSTGNKETIFLNIYRPSSSKISTFLDEFQNLLEIFVPSPSDLIISGDFNIHADYDLTTSHKLSGILDNFHLTHRVTNFWLKQFRTLCWGTYMLGGELRAKPEPRARSAREMRAKPESRAEPEIERGGVWGGGSVSPSPEIFWKFIPETMQSGVCLLVPAQELSAKVEILPWGPSIKYVTLLGVWVSVTVCDRGEGLGKDHVTSHSFFSQFYVLFYISSYNTIQYNTIF